MGTSIWRGVLCQSFVTNVGPSDRLSQNIYASDQACGGRQRTVCLG
jgi:hypothetical protein